MLRRVWQELIQRKYIKPSCPFAKGWLGELWRFRGVNECRISDEMNKCIELESENGAREASPEGRKKWTKSERTE